MSGNRVQEREYLNYEAETREKKADVLAAHGKHKEAYEEMKLAFAVQRKALDDNKTVAGLRLTARVQNAMADVCWHAYLVSKSHSKVSHDNFNHASDGYYNAMMALRKIDKKEKTDADYRLLADSYFGLGNINIQQEGYTVARMHFEDAIKALGQVNVRTYEDEKHLKLCNENRDYAARSEHKARFGLWSTVRHYGISGAPVNESKQSHQP